MNSADLYFVKIGGSLVTDKRSPFTIKPDILKQTAVEIRQALDQGFNLVLGHGAGSFGHAAVQQYLSGPGAPAAFGLAAVADATARLNRLVIAELLNQNIPAVTVSLNSALTSHKGILPAGVLAPFANALRQRLVPVVYGDVLWDDAGGFYILPTEDQLLYLASAAQNIGYKVKRFVFCCDTPGVLDRQGARIEQITAENAGQYTAAIAGSSGIDVTGGMRQKVAAALTFASRGIPGMIADGNRPGFLVAALRGSPAAGTLITAP